MIDTPDLFRHWKEKPSHETLVALIGGLQRPVYGLCHRILGHSQDAEDAAQKVLLQLLKVLPTLPDEDRIRGWLYRASILTAISLKKGRMRRMRHEKAERPKADLPLSEEESDAVHRHIAELDEDLRRIVVDYYFDRKTLAELAARNRCSTGAVWKKLQKAHERLRRTLTSAGIAGGAAAVISFLESRPASAISSGALSEAVLEQARQVASRAKRAPSAAGVFALKTLAATAVVVASVLGYTAFRSRESSEEPAPRSSVPVAASRRPSLTTVVPPAKDPLPPKEAAVAEQPDTDSLLARLIKFREIIDACLAKQSFDGTYTRAEEPLHPLVLKEPETYIEFVRRPENRKYLDLFLDLLRYPDPILDGVKLPDLPKCISEGLTELLASGTREDKLRLLEKCECLRSSFREYPLTDAFIAPCFEFVAGSDTALRRQALGFLFIHGHQDRLDLLQSVWQRSRDFETRRMCLSFLCQAKSTAGSALFYQGFDEMMQVQDQKWIRILPLILRDRLQASNTEEDQDRSLPFLRTILLKQTDPLEFRAHLSTVCSLPAAKQAILLRDFVDRAPSAELRERIRGTLELIARGETRPGALSELLMYGNTLGKAAPPPPVAENPNPPAPAENPPPPPAKTGGSESASPSVETPPQKSGTTPSEFFSKDRKLKAILKKGVNGFTSEFQIWDTEKDVRLIKGYHAFQITAFAISDDRKLYATADAEGFISVRSLEGSYSGSFQSAGRVTSLSFSADGMSLQSPLQSWSLKKR